VDQDKELRKQLHNMLLVRQAHLTFEDAVADFPLEHINSRPPNNPYTFWHLVEHLRLAQWDILDYIRNPNYAALSWPDDYWPARDATADPAAWQASIDQFLADRQALADIVADPATDLYAQIPHGYPGHNVLREILVVADHNAYHIGELAIQRQNMSLWPPDRK
jgi:hypothetical protein